MLAGLIIVVLVGFLVWFCTATKPGRACASWLQVVLSWLWLTLGLNVWTIIAAHDPADRKTVALTLLLGLVVGLIVIWVIEEIHERINHYPMAAFHFLPHGQRNAHPLIKKENISENIILG